MTDQKRTGYALLALASVGVFAFAGMRIATNLQRRRAVHKAQDEIAHSYWALAFENLDPYRQDLVRTDEDCNTLLNVYSKSKNVQRLQWATEACLEAGVQTYEVFLYQASVYELQGRDQDAANVLFALTQQVGQRYEAFKRLADIHTRLHDDVRATEAMIQAASRVDDVQMKLDAVRLALGQNRAEDVKGMVPAIRDIKTDNPEVKLVVARAFARLHDYAGAQEQLNQAKELMPKVDAERKKKLEHDYADVFSIHDKQAAR